MSHILTTTSKSEIPSNIIFFDSESRVDIGISDQDITKVLNGEKIEKEHELYLICACFSRRNKKGIFTEDWKDYYKDGFTDSFWNDVDQFVGFKKKCFMFAHNAGYDVIATGCIPALLKRGYRVEAFSDSNPFFLKLAKYIGDKKENGIDRSLVIVSSTNYYQFSLAKLGECFGIPKTEIDYKDATTEAAIPYCRNDVQILKAAMLGFIHFIKTEELGSFALTIAGQAMHAFRKRFLKPDQIFIHSDEPSIILERESYAGGRNEAWRVGSVTDKIYYVDVNSMYPYVMKQFDYPIKLVTHRKQTQIREMEKWIQKGYLVIAKVKLKTDARIYFKKAGKLIFPVGEFVTTLSTPELIRAIADKSIIQVLSLNLYEKANIFADYVDYFYNKRLEAKAANDEVRTLLYKLFLNSLYGKWGQKALNWDLCGDAPIDMIKTETIINARTKEAITYKVFGGSRFMKENKPDGQNNAYNAFTAIASHCTAYARMLLWKYIEIAGQENVYYMDTDSLFVNTAGYNNLLAAGYIDDKELGKLKLEQEGSEILINGCKDYVFNKKTKVKGIAKGSKQISDNKYISTVWRGMSKFIQSGDLGHYKNEMIVKTLSRRYEKGLINPEGSVSPFNFENDVNLFDLEVEQKKQEIKGKLQELKEYIKLDKQLRDPAIDIILKLHGLKGDLNGAYREELSNFNYPYRNFKNGCSINKAVWMINGQLGTEYNANDLLELLYNHIHRKSMASEIKALEEQLDQVRVQDYYKKEGRKEGRKEASYQHEKSNYLQNNRKGMS